MSAKAYRCSKRSLYEIKENPIEVASEWREHLDIFSCVMVAGVNAKIIH